MIAAATAYAAAGPVRQVGIAKPTSYRWNESYAWLAFNQVRELKQLQDENERLKKRVAELSRKPIS